LLTIFRDASNVATRFVGLIGKLFAVEARVAKWTAQRRQRLRARYSSRVLAVIEHMMVKQLPTIVPSSLLGKALQYIRGQWAKLVRYAENGNLPISNNLCENAIRPFVAGRKGWLFADTVAGGQANANLYSLVETCKANGIDPYRYLVLLFGKLPLAATADDDAALMPWALPDTPNLCGAWSIDPLTLFRTTPKSICIKCEPQPISDCKSLSFPILLPTVSSYETANPLVQLIL
jgi:hypothetical protein